jgi:hypothetical protein
MERNGSALLIEFDSVQVNEKLLRKHGSWEGYQQDTLAHELNSCINRDHEETEAQESKTEHWLADSGPQEGNMQENTRPRK